MPSSTDASSHSCGQDDELATVIIELAEEGGPL